MRKSRLSWYKQDRLIEHFVSGTTARYAAEIIGVNRKTAAYYFHRLRELIAYHSEIEAHEFFDGEIEAYKSELIHKVYIEKTRTTMLNKADKIMKCLRSLR